MLPDYCFFTVLSGQMGNLEVPDKTTTTNSDGTYTGTMTQNETKTVNGQFVTYASRYSTKDNRFIWFGM